MAMSTISLPALTLQDIPEDTRVFLDLKENADAFDVKTLSGARLVRPKADLHFAWQLLRGIWDNGADTTEERRLDRQIELDREEQKTGIWTK